MKIKIVLCLLLSLCFINGYSLNAANNHAPNTAHVAKPQNMSGKVMEILIIANEGEIAASRMALKKSSNPQVKAFAHYMIKQHTGNLSKTIHLGKKLDIKPVVGHVALSMKQKGANKLATLKSLHGAAFDKKYISDMVADHKKLLHLLTRIEPSIKNPAIKHHLEDTIKHVKMHLHKVQEIQKSMH